MATVTVDMLQQLDQRITTNMNDVGQINMRLGDIQTNITDVREGFEEEAKKFNDQIGMMFANHQNKIDGIINDATSQFAKHDQNYAGIIQGATEKFQTLDKQLGEQSNAWQSFYTAADKAMTDINVKISIIEAKLNTSSSSMSGSTDIYERLKKLEENRGNERREGKAKYLPMKNLIPKVMTDKVEEWRRWKEDTMDYLDMTNPGMKDFLEDLEAQDYPISEVWLQARGAPEITGERVAIWRPLKALTGGEARDVIQGVSDEDGWQAWQQLHRNFGPSIDATQGRVLAELGSMAGKPAKTPSETRTLLLDMEKSVKLVQDVTGSGIDTLHKKSIVLGILDPTTRQHTTQYHGSSTPYAEFVTKIREFVNSVAGSSGKDAMHIEAFQDM